MTGSLLTDAFDLQPEAAAIGGVLPPLRSGYEYAPLPQLLAEPGVVAVIGFGSAAPDLADPRYLRVPLEPVVQPAPQRRS